MKLRRTIAALTATALVVGIAGCSSSDVDESKVTLNAGQLGQAKVVEALLTAAGQDDGRDYDIAWNLFEAGPPAIEAIPSGAVDVVMMADTPMIFAQAGGVEASIVAVGLGTPAGASQVEIVVKGDSPITNINDLVGKKVAITEGTTLQYSFIRMLEAAGLSYEDITPVNLSLPDAVTALENGDVDAASLLDPQRARVVAQGGRVVANADGLVPDANITVASQAALEDPAKAAAIGDFVQRVDAAYQWAEANQDKWADEYAKLTGLEPEIAADVVARQWYERVAIDDSVIADQQTQADVFTTLGLLPVQLDVTAQFDDRYNDSVAVNTAVQG